MIILHIYIIGAVIAYIIGSFNPALLISNIQKKDIRSHGSGNLGASNATILLGWKIGFTVAILDILKAFIPIMLTRILLPQYALLPYIVATCVILGHIFPFYLRFKGGKGFATYMGAILGLSFIAFIVIGLIFLIVSFFSDYIVMGTFTVITLFPVYLAVFTRNISFVSVILIASVVIFFKHTENISKIKNKEEIGIRAAFSGKFKLK